MFSGHKVEILNLNLKLISSDFTTNISNIMNRADLDFHV